MAEEAYAYYDELLRAIFAGRRFLIAGPIAVGLNGLARRLTGLRAERPFLIGGSEGTGTLPTPDEAELRVLGTRSTAALEEFRNLHRVIEDLPDDLRGDIDAWDPTGTARFIFASPLAVSLDAAGRKAYAARPPAWATLEDKVQIDAFWDAVGVQRAPGGRRTPRFPADRSEPGRRLRTFHAPSGTDRDRSVGCSRGRASVPVLGPSTRHAIRELRGRAQSATLTRALFRIVSQEVPDGKTPGRHVIGKVVSRLKRNMSDPECLLRRGYGLRR